MTATAGSTWTGARFSRLWLDPERHELILERAFPNHAEQKVTFLGVPELADADGTLLRAGTGQPLFHVGHSADGTESQPLNRWRIVHLTDAPDQQLIAVFEHMAASPWLASTQYPSSPRSLRHWAPTREDARHRVRRRSAPGAIQSAAD